MCMVSCVCLCVCICVCLCLLHTDTDLTPMNFGLSPGAVQGERINSDWT